jgi:hypothetical protein
LLCIFAAEMKKNCLQIALAHFDEEQFWIIFAIKTMLNSTTHFVIALFLVLFLSWNVFLTPKC